MKLIEDFKNYSKDMVYELYVRLTPDFKEYDKITKSKMIAKIISDLSDPNTIIDLCTTKELKLLNSILNKEEIDTIKNIEILSMLRKKKIITEFDKIDIYSELKETIKTALKTVNWKKAKEKDRINELSIGLIKVYGELLEIPLVNITCSILNISEETLLEHFKSNKLFNFYCFRDLRYIDSFDQMLPTCTYHDYLDYIEYLDNKRMEYEQMANKTFDVHDYTNFFYFGLNINNKKVKKLYDLINNNFARDFIIQSIAITALLQEEPDDLMDLICQMLNVSEKEVDKYNKVIIDALNEIPSGALNSATPNEHCEFLKEKDAFEDEQLKSFVNQKDAHLSEKDTKLFYKLYFALLEYTNNVYHITNKITKIYQTKSINPANLNDIVEYYWENAKEITSKFIKENKYKFNFEELDLVRDFPKGKRSNYVIANYEEEYTAFMNEERVYMVKGITCNIDEVIPFNSIPTFARTTILPFKGYLIYDSMLSTYPISFGLNFSKTVKKELSEKIKYYHM